MHGPGEKGLRSHSAMSKFSEIEISRVFVWFQGVVEDINDPMQLGRARVRCFGFHSSDRSQIPTSSLPWATLLLPATAASMSGIGVSGTGILPGSWVVGFFRDGSLAQDPVILGTIASISTKGNPAMGFSDPAGVYPLTSGEADIPSCATGEFANSPSFIKKVDTRQTAVPEAVPPSVPSVSTPEDSGYYTRPTWSVPNPTDVVKPSYPYCSATVTRSGHTIELDDTPGKERISILHKSGSYVEIGSTGDVTASTVGDRYSVVLGSEKALVRGTVSLTVNGDLRTLVKGNYYLEVEGNATENIKGSKQIKIGGSEQTEIGFERAFNIGGNVKGFVNGFSETTISGKQSHNVGGNLELVAGGDGTLAFLGKGSLFGSTQLTLSSVGDTTVVGSTVKLNP